MQNSVFYCNKNLISKIQNQDIIDEYNNVTFEQNNLKVIDLKLSVRSHRLIFTSQTTHAFLIEGQKIQSVGLSESGLIWKQYSVKLHTQHGKVKIYLKNYNQAKLSIQGVLNKKAWNNQGKVQKGPQIYSGMFKKIQKQKQTINTQGQTVSSSFNSFQDLFVNIKDIKSIMSNMKVKQGTANSQNPQVNKILKDIGFVSVISKGEAGNNFISHLAKDLYNICTSTLFKNFGGMVPLIDLQLQLVSAEELYEACKLIQSLGFQAKLVTYENNIKMIEQSSLNPQKDFETQFSQYFKDYRTGYSAQQIANKKGIPLSIIEIKLRNAVKRGQLAIDDRIQGIKFYKNYFLSI